MYGKTEGSASPNAHALFRAGRPTSKRSHDTPLKSSPEEGCLSAEASPRCREALWSPGWGRGKAAGSTTTSGFLLGQPCAEPKCPLQLYREAFSGGVLALHKLVGVAGIRGVGASALHRGSSEPLLLPSGWCVSGCYLLGKSRSSFHYSQHSELKTLTNDQLTIFSIFRFPAAGKQLLPWNHY